MNMSNRPVQAIAQMLIAAKAMPDTTWIDRQNKAV
jgi:hypothetical protein